MAIDYVALENRLFRILSEYLPNTKIVNLENSFIWAMLGSNEVLTNYLSDDSIWFFRLEISTGSQIHYYFGINNENDIKLSLIYNNIYRFSSSLALFNSKQIAIKIKFTKEGAKIFDSMKEIFTIKDNPNNRKFNYLMLIDEDESEIVPAITNLINLIDFEYGDENLLIKGFKDSPNFSVSSIDEVMSDSSESEDSSFNEFEEIEIEDSFSVVDEGSLVNGLEEGEANPFEKERTLDSKMFAIPSEDHEFSVDKIISKIDCTLFDKNHENESLDEEFGALVESPIFNIVSRELNDEECSKLVIRIKGDIADEKISGDAADIQDFYFEQYESIKKQFSLNGFLNEYLKGDDFANLLDEYDNYTEDMVLGIIKQVRDDISDDDSMDEDKIILKVEYYFKAESNKNVYFSQIDKIKADSEYYKMEYNLTNKEFDEILDYIQIKISQGYHIKNINHCLINKIKERVNLNRDASRLKLRKLLNDSEFIEENNITQEQLDNLSQHVGGLIYRNQIRSDNINEEYLVAIVRWRL